MLERRRKIAQHWVKVVLRIPGHDGSGERPEQRRGAAEGEDRGDRPGCLPGRPGRRRAGSGELEAVEDHDGSEGTLTDRLCGVGKMPCLYLRERRDRVSRVAPPPSGPTPLFRKSSLKLQ